MKILSLIVLGFCLVFTIYIIWGLIKLERELREKGY